MFIQEAMMQTNNIHTLIQDGYLQRAIEYLQDELESKLEPYGKTPTLYLRDERGKLTSEINPECQWVFDGEGVPTYKWDGTNVRVEVYEGRVRTILGRDKKSQLPACAQELVGQLAGRHGSGWYHAELVGPKVNGNRHRATEAHLEFFDVTPALLRPYETPIETVAAHCPTSRSEGVVWHHPDGRRAKLRAQDLKRAGMWPE